MAYVDGLGFYAAVAEVALGKVWVASNSGAEELVAIIFIDEQDCGAKGLGDGGYGAQDFLVFTL